MLRAVLANKKILIGLLIVGAMVLIAAFADQLAPYSYDQYNVGPKLSPPTLSHIFGTDYIGRDVLSRGT